MAVEYDYKLIHRIRDVHFKDRETISWDDLRFIFTEMNQSEKYIGKSALSKKRIARYHRFQWFVRMILYKVMMNLDTMVLLTGLKGAGKSSTALMLARHWNSLLGKKFDPTLHFAYTNAQFSKLLDTLPPFSVIVADEAVNFCMATEWAKPENRKLRKKLAQIRTKHFFVIMCWPLKVSRIEKTYMDSFVSYWVDIYSRGRSAVYLRDSNPIHDPWRLELFKKIGTYSEFTDWKTIEKKLQSHPNFWMSMVVPKAPPKLYKRYLGVREKNVYGTNIEEVSKDDIIYALMIQVFMDLLVRDSSVGVRRMVMHIRNEYGVSLAENDFKVVIDESKKILDKCKKHNLLKLLER